MTGGKVGAVAGELSSRLAHPAWPTGGAAVLALIAAVGILVLAPAADAQSPCMPWEIYRPSLRMCEAMTDTSGQPAMPSKVGVRKRGRTPPSLQEPAGPKVVVRERGRRQHSVEKPKRPKLALASTRIPTAAMRARTAAPPVGHAGCANLLLSSPATAPTLPLSSWHSSTSGHKQESEGWFRCRDPQYPDVTLSIPGFQALILPRLRCSYWMRPSGMTRSTRRRLPPHW